MTNDPQGYTPPEIDIVEAREITQVIDFHLGGTLTPENEDQLAQVLGHKSANSGAFRAKLAELSKYGLLMGEGERELTSLAHTLLENEPSAVDTIISNSVLYSQAQQEFETETPDISKWENFLQDYGFDNILAEDDENRTRKQYLKLKRKLTSDNYNDETPVSKEEFQANIDRLSDERKRDFAIEALHDLANHRLPNSDPIKRLLEQIESDDEGDIEKLDDFIEILAKICSNSTKEAREHDDKIEALAREQIQRTEQNAIRGDAWSIITYLFPENLDEKRARELWDIAKELLEEGIQEENASKATQANKIVKKLARDWTPGKDDLIQEMEKDVWKDVGKSNNFDDYYVDWLRLFREARGIDVTTNTSL